MDQAYGEAESELLALIKAMKLPTQPSNLRLPDFDPEKKDMDARAWVTTADMCLTDENKEGPSLVIALSRALKGSASTWLSSVSFPGMTWTEFKELFVASSLDDIYYVEME
ncbi:hypothetical protein EVAR_5109_1 [Eumeta japonica]|uniref:Retrotransposon gag domain-containing protein n=1 Tax=Eumeta variegata TaxID=151549 RepID=A0A4C1SU91_EUMVA|nr:hypothetical protein EVAR_5109_1 [Eumeta japonica]